MSFRALTTTTDHNFAALLSSFLSFCSRDLSNGVLNSVFHDDDDYDDDNYFLYPQ